MKIRTGIIFGGSSREREISFAGGRTVYDNLDKSIFEPVPLFVDSNHEFILLDWQFIYKGTIRDFYPPVDAYPTSEPPFQIYLESLGQLSTEERDTIISKVGKRVRVDELPKLIDFAFLALHGAFGEDGTIQGLLEFYHIPYSGSGILPSAIGINKAVQKRLMNEAGFAATKFFALRRNDWVNGVDAFAQTKKEIGFPCVVRPANQGSSIGVSIISTDDKQSFDKAIRKAFFVQTVDPKEWNNRDEQQKRDWINALVDIREGIGLPVRMNDVVVFHPNDLFRVLDAASKSSTNPITLETLDGESEVLIEEFIEGKEFSCIVVQDDSRKPIALPPTEIVKGKEVFDYRSKYLPGLSRKITPIELPEENIEAIRKECERLFNFFQFNVYARIDGFFRKDGKIVLNDPNTTSGMLPSSFFFHQAAEIGLTPSGFLTYIIHTSVRERIATGTRTWNAERLMEKLENLLEQKRVQQTDKIKVAVIMGGYSSERHISVESGRNVFEKLSSSTKYEPIPVFLLGNDKAYELYEMPVNIMLKDNADDIREKILNYKRHPVIERIREQCKTLTEKFAAEGYRFQPRKISFEDLAREVQAVFIALHGRPGEDGNVQRELERVGLGYNGSTPDSASRTINKYITNQTLKQAGLSIAEQTLADKSEWLRDKESFYKNILTTHQLPLIAKPVDDGCSSAVKKIKTEAELKAFVELMFRDSEELLSEASQTLHLKTKEEFPRKQQILFEDLIGPNGATHFLEITGGMLTTVGENGEPVYELFEPSEALATSDVLSLEEKFLAGEGQNITPARFAKDKSSYEKIMQQVKRDLEKAAKALNVTGYCRIDAFVRIFPNDKAETVVIEINSLPGMTPATCIFHQAALHNYKPYDFIDKILTFSLQRKEATVH